MHTVNNRTQLICCVYILYGAGELTITQPYFFHATSVAIYPLGTHVVRTSATEHLPQVLVDDIAIRLLRKYVNSYYEHFKFSYRHGLKESLQ